jgi:N-acetylglutamate synthase-like GNAT family acetyltransferase
MHYRQLPAPLKPLVDTFYRRLGSAMRATASAQIWVGEDTEIVAALCLQKVAQGHWLTSLLVAQTLRGQGVAGQLVEAALAECTTPVWLFCHPDLCNFYQRLGFTPTTDLPQVLAERLARYRRSKSLLTFFRQPSAKLTAYRSEISALPMPATLAK